jgi:hypothetical protein
MQRTRDNVWLHGKAHGREPLIFVVLQQACLTKGVRS